MLTIKKSNGKSVEIMITFQQEIVSPYTILMDQSQVLPKIGDISARWKYN
jgi:hypothetical protein